MEKYNLKYALKHLNKKRIKNDLKTGGWTLLSTIGATALFAGASYVLTGCSKHDDEKVATSTDATENDATEVSTEEVAPVEVEEEVVDENQEEYEVIDAMEEDIVDFAETNLPNGFIEVNEDNKLERAKMFTDAYIMMNLSSNKGQINPATLMVLNQNNILIPTEIKDNYKDFVYQIGDYCQIVTPETMIDFEVLVQEQDDAAFLNNLETEIANMNVATTSEERQTRIKNIIAIRDSILENASTKTYSSSTIYTAINMIIKADAMAKAYGSQIFDNEEAKMQLYTTFYDGYCADLGIEEYEYSGTIFSSASSFESMYFNSVATKLDNVISVYQGVKCDSYYSYEEVTERISERLLGLYKAPEMDAIAKENAIREKAGNSKTPVGTKTTKTNVPESQVPEQYREKTTTTPDYSENQDPASADKVKPASEASDVYIKAKGEGIAAGSADAANAYTANYAGNATSMPAKSVGAAPAVGSTNYNDVYNYFYNISWNEFRSNAIAQEAAARKENEAATPTFEPVDGPATEYEETTEDVPYVPENGSKTTPETENKAVPENGTTFVPVENGEEVPVDEKIETVTVGSAIQTKISVLRNLRNELMTMAYNNNTDEKISVKRV